MKIFMLDIYDESFVYNGVEYYTAEFNIYLPPETSHLYTIQVIDDYSQTVNDVLIRITRYINSTIGTIDISTLLTSGNGIAQVYLISGYPYGFNFTKTGYTPLNTSWIPPDADNVTYTVKMSLLTSGIPPPGYDYFWANISFTSVMTGPGYMQLGNITTSYNDKNSSTVNTDVYLFEYYNGSYTLLSSTHNTSNSFTLVNSSINTTRSHKTVLYFNNTATFIDASSPIILFIPALYVYTNDTGYTKFNFDDRVTPIVGPFLINNVAIPWGSVVAFFVGLAVLVMLGPYHVGVALIGSGLMTGFVNGFFSIYLLDEFPVLLVTLCPVFVVLGIMYMFSKQGRDYL